MQAAFETAFRARGVERLFVRMRAGAQHLHHLLLARDVAVAVQRRGREQHLQRLRLGRRQVGGAAGGHDRHQRAHARRMAQRDLLADGAAHRGADDVGAIDAQRIEQADRIVGHVGQRVRHLARAHRHAGQCLPEQLGHVGNTRGAQARGLSDVAVVEADDAVAATGQAFAEGFVPRNHLRAQAHDEQQRWRRRIAEAVVGQLDAVGRSERRGRGVALHGAWR
ncbi:hypothetical protein D9M72_374070 [compost metagenome]